MSNLILRMRIFLKSLFVKCKVCFDGDIYPIYGVAPHYHDFSNSDSSIIFYEKKLWPDNFIPDIEEGESPEQCKTGVYYCTNEKCINNKNNKKRFNLKTYNGPEELKMKNEEISIEEVKLMSKFLYDIWDNEEEDKAWSKL